MKILFIDDDPDFRGEYVKQLKKDGFEVIEAENEADARNIIEQENFDLAVVDLMLDHTDSGFTLCHHIKKKSSAIPVILLNSANGELGTEFSLETPSERAWIKADVLLEKPIRFEQLRAEIDKLLGVTSESHH